MQTTWNDALAAVLVHEGGFVHHEKDPGGATCKGVTLAVYERYCGDCGLSSPGVEGLKAIPNEHVSDLYKSRYWDRVRGDELPPGIDYVIFDLAVNSGVGRARQFVREVLGLGQGKSARGALDDDIIGQLWAMPDWDAFIDAFCDHRLAFMQRLRIWDTFGRGWSRRVNGVKAHGMCLAPDDPAAYVAALHAGEEPAVGDACVAATDDDDEGADGWSAWNLFD